MVNRSKHLDRVLIQGFRRVISMISAPAPESAPAPVLACMRFHIQSLASTLVPAPRLLSRTLASTLVPAPRLLSRPLVRPLVPAPRLLSRTLVRTLVFSRPRAHSHPRALTISLTLALTLIFVPLLILTMAVSLTGCSADAAARPGRPTLDFTDTVSAENYQSDHTREPEGERALHIAVSPTLSQKSTIEAYRLLAAHIGSKLGRETILLERKSYAEINVLLANGGADVAFLASGAYISYTGLEDIVPLVTQIRFGLPYYHSYIIVAKDSGLTKLEDLKGRTFAFTDPLSFSGYYVPTYMLRQIGESPDTFFKSTIFTYGHEKALQAVANKMVDAAAIGSHVYADSLVKKDGFADRVQIIAQSEKSGNGPVVVRKSLGDAEIQSLKEIFMAMHQDPDLQDALRSLLVDAYVETSPELYAFQRQIIHEFGTRE